MLHRLRSRPTQINLVGGGLHTKRIGGKRHNLPAMSHQQHRGIIFDICCRSTAGRKNTCNNVHLCGPKHESHASAIMPPRTSRALRHYPKANKMINQSHALATLYIGFDHAVEWYHFEPLWLSGCSGSSQRD